jgi:hypothetical protein
MCPHPIMYWGHAIQGFVGLCGVVNVTHRPIPRATNENICAGITDTNHKIQLLTKTMPLSMIHTTLCVKVEAPSMTKLSLTDELNLFLDSVQHEFQRIAHGMFISNGSVLALGNTNNHDAQWLKQLYPNVTVEHTHHILREHSTLSTNKLFDNVCFRNFAMPHSEDLFLEVQKIGRLLHERGKLVISFNDENTSTLNYGYLIQLFETSGLFLKTKEKITHPQHNHISYIILGFEKTPIDLSRGLYVIERILNNDKRTTTYKYALIRALCRIARNSFHSVRWVSSDEVAIPMSLLTMEWIRLYWNIVYSDSFIDQGNEKNKPLIVRTVLNEMNLNNDNDLYKSLSVLISQPEKYEAQLLKISKSIINGPIKHSGGMNNGEEGFKIFKHYTSPHHEIRFSSDIWLDICRFEHWIEDSIKIRWSKNLSGNLSISRGEYLDILETDTTDQRATDDIRKVLKKTSSTLNCVWTERPLTESAYQVDHVIPFAIWGNNDLWNLLPVDKKVNNDKTDKIPTSNLIEKQQKLIFSYWDIYSKNQPKLFYYQMKNALGCEVTQFNQDWQPRAINNIIERAESIAQHRGLARWEPNNLTIN